MPHKTRRPGNQTSFETKKNSQVPYFTETYHSKKITTQRHWITPFLFESTTL
jgi:hypothetical protein